MIKEEQKTTKNRDTLCAALFIGAFALIPVSVIGISIKDWIKEQKKVEQIQRQKEEAKAKTAYYAIEAEKLNQR